MTIAPTSLVLVEYEADGDPEDAHDEDVVHGHAHVLAVVQRRDLNVASLPRQEGTKHLSQVDMLTRTKNIY